jgi:hypothetical protein
MPQIQYDAREIEEGDYFYFEGRIYRAMPLGFDIQDPGPLYMGIYNATLKSVSTYIDHICGILDTDPGNIVNNPFGMLPTQGYLAYINSSGITGINQQIDIPLPPGGIQAMVGQPQTYNEKISSWGENKKQDPKETEEKLYKEHNKVLTLAYGFLNEFRDIIIKNFKPGGAAATAMAAFAQKYESLVELFADSQRLHRSYQVEYEKLKIRNNELVGSRDQIYNELEALKSTHFDIKQFGKYCDSLYKTVAQPGPKIEEMRDLPKLTDYMYAQIIRSQTTEPEVP